MKTVTKNTQLKRVIVNGFKSINKCNLELGALNILIGANGSGKSNFIGFFTMIQQMLEQALQNYVGLQGGPDAILHFGRKRTEKLESELYFGENGYKFSLEPTQDNRFMFNKESFYWETSGDHSLGKDHFESKMEEGTSAGIDEYVINAMRNWRVYHFHDTSETARIKQLSEINDYIYLKHDARNLAAYLYLLKMKYRSNYDQIIKLIRLANPFFNDFRLHPYAVNKSLIELEWTQNGSTLPFKAYQLSDGTLRFICLITVFLQPEDKCPDTILIDEPELGLHPYAIKLLASIIKSVSFTKQIIVSTQSVEFIDEFDVEDIIVVDREEDRSIFRRLQETEFSQWLEEYSIGELWKKNILGGRP